MFPAHPPQSTPASTPYHCLYQDEPKTYGGSYRQSPRPGSYRAKRILPICKQRPSWRNSDISTSEPGSPSVSYQFGAKTSEEKDSDISGHANQKIEKNSSHKPEVKRGAMGILVPPFKDTQGLYKNTPGCVVLWEPTAPLGTAHYRMATTPS